MRGSLAPMLRATLTLAGEIHPLGLISARKGSSH